MSLNGAETRAGSDGNFTAALGVPTLDGLGPEGAHSCSFDEYVVVASLPRRAALLAGIIAGLPSLPRGDRSDVRGPLLRGRRIDAPEI